MDFALQYTTAADGVRIAYVVSGRGPILVHMPNMGVSMLQLEREIAERDAWSTLLAQRFTLVRYDPRGVGYSQREVPDVSPEAHLLDLEAVVSALNLGRLALFGFLTSAFLAPCYAAQHGEKVSRLVLWPPDTRSMSSQEYRSLAGVAASDWETFTETYAHLAMGWAEGNAAHRYARVMRESVTPQMFQRQTAESHVPTSRLLALAPQVSVPTLVLQRRMKFAAERVGRLVAALPDARLQILDGENTVPYLGDASAVVEVIARFAGTGPAARQRRSMGALGVGGAVELTAREQEILRLLTAGRSNDEIADELVLSVRTVERHLYNVYTKLGISGKSARAFAAAYAMNGHLG